MKKHQANQLSTKNCNKKQLSERLKLIKKVIETKMDSVNVQRTKDVSETPKSNIVENADVSNSQVLYNVQEESGTSRTNQRLECIEEDADLVIPKYQIIHQERAEQIKTDWSSTLIQVIPKDQIMHMKSQERTEQIKTDWSVLKRTLNGRCY